MDIQNIMQHWELIKAIVIGLPAFIMALIAFFMLIPGDQPEKFLQGVLDVLQKVVDVIKKFSR